MSQEPEDDDLEPEYDFSGSRCGLDGSNLPKIYMGRHLPIGADISTYAARSRDTDQDPEISGQHLQLRRDISP